MYWDICHPGSRSQNVRVRSKTVMCNLLIKRVRKWVKHVAEKWEPVFR